MHDIDVIRRFTLDFLGRGDAVAADETLDEKVQAITGLKPAGPIDGIAEYKQTVAAFIDAFPSVRPLQIVDQFACADRVVTRFHAWQRHEKSFFGIAPTGRVVLFDEMHVARIKKTVSSRTSSPRPIWNSKC